MFSFGMCFAFHSFISVFYITTCTFQLLCLFILGFPFFHFLLCFFRHFSLTLQFVPLCCVSHYFCFSVLSLFLLNFSICPLILRFHRTLQPYFYSVFPIPSISSLLLSSPFIFNSPIRPFILCLPLFLCLCLLYHYFFLILRFVPLFHACQSFHCTFALLHHHYFSCWLFRWCGASWPYSQQQYHKGHRGGTPVVIPSISLAPKCCCSSLPPSHISPSSFIITLHNSSSQRLLSTYSYSSASSSFLSTFIIFIYTFFMLLFFFPLPSSPPSPPQVTL